MSVSKFQTTTALSHTHSHFYCICSPTVRIHSYMWTASSSECFVAVEATQRETFECESYYSPAVYLQDQEQLKNAIIAKGRCMNKKYKQQKEMHIFFFLSLVQQSNSTNPKAERWTECVLD